MEEAIIQHGHPLTAQEITQHIEITRKVVLSTQNIANHVKTRPSHKQRFKRIPDDAGENPRRKYLYDTLLPRPEKHPEPPQELIEFHSILNRGIPLQNNFILNRLWGFIRETEIFRTVDLSNQLRRNRGGNRAINVLAQFGLIKQVPPPHQVPPDYDAWNPRRRKTYIQEHKLPHKFRTSLYYTYDPTEAIKKLNEYTEREKEKLDMRRDHLINFLKK